MMRLRSLWFAWTLSLLVVSSCTVFRMAEISLDDVPADIRERHGGEDVTWRACYEQGGYIIVWFEAETGPVSGEKMYCFETYRRDENGKLVRYDAGAFERRGDYWRTGRTTTQQHSWVSASGTVFSGNAKRAIGFLTDGQVCEGLVVNGFWYLCADETTGEFKRIDIRDVQGRSIRTFEKLR